MSPEVKTSVIEALGGSMDNVEVLIRIYKKGKAAEKRAALTALVQLNSPEADGGEICGKYSRLKTNFKEGNVVFVSVSLL